MGCRVGCRTAPGECENRCVPVVDLNHLAPLTGVVNDNSAAYDLVLLAHVLSAVVGLVAVVVAGGFALALRGALARGGSLPDPVVRYFRPGVNWVGRVLFLVPVLGVALVAMSGGQWTYADAWIGIGLAGWVVVAMAAEGILWPTERRLQEIVAAGAGRSGGAAVEVVTTDGATVEEVPPLGAGQDDPMADVATQCLQAGLTGIGLALALVVLSVLMVAKP
jgi:hypothetical protein